MLSSVLFSSPEEVSERRRDDEARDDDHREKRASYTRFFHSLPLSQHPNDCPLSRLPCFPMFPLLLSATAIKVVARPAYPSDERPSV